MTQKALNSCARGQMWNEYNPTPLTKKWLEENGYIKLDGTSYNTK